MLLCRTAVARLPPTAAHRALSAPLVAAIRSEYRLDQDRRSRCVLTVDRHFAAAADAEPLELVNELLKCTMYGT